MLIFISVLLILAIISQFIYSLFIDQYIHDTHDKIDILIKLIAMRDEHLNKKLDEIKVLVNIDNEPISDEVLADFKDDKEIEIERKETEEEFRNSIPFYYDDED